MPLTSWKTWASGDTLTAADMNTYVRDNGRWLSGHTTGGSPNCRVYNSTNFNVAGSTDTNVTFDSERYDDGGMHSTATNTDRLTVPSGGDGIYIVFGTVIFGAFSDATLRRCRLTVNGTTFAQHQQPAIATASINTAISIVGVSLAGATDIFRLNVRQESTSALGLDLQASPNGSPEFGAVWICE
jgi:hypothetical protein